MENISPEFTFTDALLLYSIAYCHRFGYKTTLGRILLTTDMFNRSEPTALELEDGLSRLIVGGYVEIQGQTYIATKSGINLFNDVTEEQNPKLNSSQQIKNLVDRLNASHLRSITKQLIITDAQYSEAIQEANTLFKEISKKAKGRKAKETS